ncbi:MAG: hypothetical protein ACYC99_11100, partial [Candidatus Geothermincolia bacterium]
MACKGSVERRKWSRALIALVVIAVALTLFAAGCGLQTDEANNDLKKANVHQQEAETVMARLKALPTDWQNTFATNSVTPTSVAQARQLVQAREADLDALDAALKAWSLDTAAILKLNVEDKVKEYVKLKMASIKQWQDYS